MNNKNRNNNKNNKNNKYRRRYRRDYMGRMLRRIIRYQNRTTPASFGPGSQLINITLLHTGSFSEQQFFDIYSILDLSPEFSKISDDFKYFRIPRFYLTFYAKNSTSSYPLYFVVVYDGVLVNNLRLQDNVKIVPALLTRNKSYCFKMPYLTAWGGPLNSWTNRSDLANKFGDVKVQIHAPNNSENWVIRVDVAVMCRGPTLPNSEENIMKLVASQEGKI